MKRRTLGAVVLTLASIAGCRLAPNYFTLRQDLQHITKAQFTTQRDPLEKKAKDEFFHRMAVIADEPSYNEAYFEEQFQKTGGATLHERLNKVYAVWSKKHNYTSDGVESVLRFLQDTDALRKKYAAEPEPEAPEETSVSLGTGSDEAPLETLPEIPPETPVETPSENLHYKAREAKAMLKVQRKKILKIVLAAYRQYPAPDGHMDTRKEGEKLVNDYLAREEGRPLSRIVSDLEVKVTSHIKREHGKPNPELHGFAILQERIRKYEAQWAKYTGGRQ